MNRASLRLLPAAAMTLAAGLMAGYVLGSRSTEPVLPGLPRDLAAYESSLTQTLGLGDRQRKDLHILLLDYDRKRQAILDRNRELLEPELQETDRRYYAWIRSRILTPEQRQAARNLLRPAPVGEEALPAALAAGALPDVEDGQ